MTIFRRHGSRGEFQPRRRPAEWITGRLMHMGLAVFGGMKAEFIPAYLRRQMATAGVDDEMLHRVVRHMRELGDWPYAWEAEGDMYASNGRWSQATTCYYFAQRLLITASPLKERLYRQVLHAYARINHPAPLERLTIEGPDGMVLRGYLQVPTHTAARADSDGRLPLLVMIPGLTATKEELHPIATELVRRGYAVARVDGPGYGETSGHFSYDTAPFPAWAVRFLARDQRFDPSRISLMGNSLGGFYSMHAAAREPMPVSALITVSAPFAPHDFLFDLPAAHITALRYITGIDSNKEAFEVTQRLSLIDAASEIAIPVRAFHGVRDRTVPVTELDLLEQHVAGPTITTRYERAHHNCLENLQDLVAELLAWLDDTEAIVERARIVDETFVEGRSQALRARARTRYAREAADAAGEFGVA